MQVHSIPCITKPVTLSNKQKEREGDKMFRDIALVRDGTSPKQSLSNSTFPLLSIYISPSCVDHLLP